MLGNPVDFAGYAYYRTSPTATGPIAFTQHLLNFDFNFLPLTDNYHPPAADARTAPSLQQSQAMFDWWERLYDYTVVRKQAHRRCKDPIWHLFEEASLNPPGDPAQLLRHIGAEQKYRALDLRYYQDQASTIYSVSDADLQDDRWLVRVWHADHWIRCLMDRFHTKDIAKARPDLWAADDPSAPVPGSGVKQTGNANLLAFFNDGCFDQQPRRYGDVKRLNDGLRERGRKAMVSYLCNHESRAAPRPVSIRLLPRKPADLSDFCCCSTSRPEFAKRRAESRRRSRRCRRSSAEAASGWSRAGRSLASSRACGIAASRRIAPGSGASAANFTRRTGSNGSNWAKRGASKHFVFSNRSCAVRRLPWPRRAAWIGGPTSTNGWNTRRTLLQKGIPSRARGTASALAQPTTREGLGRSRHAGMRGSRHGWLRCRRQRRVSTEAAGPIRRTTTTTTTPPQLATPVTPKTVPALAKGGGDRQLDAASRCRYGWNRL